jgi:hypothetical protein
MARTKSEIGAVGLPIFAGYISLDPNKNLRGVQAVRTYREMVLDDPACAGFFNASRQLMRTDLGVEPGGTTENDKRAAEHLQSCIDDMRESPKTYLRQLESFMWSGWAIHELVWKRRNGGQGSKYDDGKVGWADWALRRQESLYRWQYDNEAGRVVGFMQRPAPTFDLRTIPFKKAIHLVADETDGSPEGVSPLRSMYRLWYFVKNLELLLGISLERFGTGLPVFELDLPAGSALSPDDEARLDAVGTGIVQNEQAYLRLPPAVKFHFAPSPGLDANTYVTVIDRFRNWMLASVLADFLALGLGDRGGAYALGKDKSELFLLALNGYQSRILEALNRQAVTRLFQYNDFGKLTDLPRLTLPAVKRYDLQTLGGFVQTIEQIGAFHPTPQDEEFFRKISDAPDVDPVTLQAYFDADEEERTRIELPPNPAPTGEVDTGADEADVTDEGEPEGESATLGRASVDGLIRSELPAARKWAALVMEDGES